MKVIFTKACVFNGHKRVVGNITSLNGDTLQGAIDAGIVEPYNGVYPPLKGRKGKTKIQLKDLK